MEAVGMESVGTVRNAAKAMILRGLVRDTDLINIDLLQFWLAPLE
jgi:hypothetical protein